MGECANLLRCPSTSECRKHHFKSDSSDNSMRRSSINTSSSWHYTLDPCCGSRGKEDIGDNWCGRMTLLIMIYALHRRIEKREDFMESFEDLVTIHCCGMRFGGSYRALHLFGEYCMVKQGISAMISILLHSLMRRLCVYSRKYSQFISMSCDL